MRRCCRSGCSASRPSGIGAAQSTVIGIGMFGGLAAIPLYLQIVKGASPTRAGLLLLPLVAGMMITVDRRRPAHRPHRSLPQVPDHRLRRHDRRDGAAGDRRAPTTPLWHTDLYMALFGVGLGMNMQTIQLAMQNAVEPRDIGVASSSGTFFRQLGGTLGAAVFLSILFSAAPGKIAVGVRGGEARPRRSSRPRPRIRISWRR